MGSWEGRVGEREGDRTGEKGGWGGQVAGKGRVEGREGDGTGETGLHWPTQIILAFAGPLPQYLSSLAR